MATLIPPQISRFTVSPGEKAIFKRLREDVQSEDWIVLHSLDIAEHRTKISGEADFICAIPGLGVLCVEVKDHSRVVRDARGIWHLGAKEDPDGPFKQAKEARFAIQKYVVGADPDLSSVVFWSCVAFTSVNFDQQDSEWHSWQIVNQRDIQQLGIAKCFARVLTNARRFLAGCPSAAWFKRTGNRPTRADCIRIGEILRSQFEFFESPRSRLQRSAIDLKRFTEEQFSALDRMESNSRVAFTGPAGCGKSLLALESARRASAAGKKSLLLCYNRLFGNWLKQASEPLGTSVRSGSFHSILLDISKVTPSNAAGFWNQVLPKLAVDAICNEDSETWTFDKLIIDEAQDLLAPEFFDCLDLMLREGLKGGEVEFFGDFENQVVYQHSTMSLIEARDRYIRDLTIYRLDENCRNLPRVGDTARVIGRMAKPYSRFLREDDQVDPFIKYFSNEQQSWELLRWALNDARQKGYLNSEITVLFPSIAQFGQSAIDIGSYRLVPYDTFVRLGADCAGSFSSVRRFKGLEARVIIVSGIDDVESDEGADLFYTACTRTTDIFYFLANIRVKEQIQSIILGRSHGS